MTSGRRSAEKEETAAHDDAPLAAFASRVGSGCRCVVGGGGGKKRMLGRRRERRRIGLLDKEGKRLSRRNGVALATQCLSGRHTFETRTRVSISPLTLLSLSFFFLPLPLFLSLPLPPYQPQRPSLSLSGALHPGRASGRPLLRLPRSVLPRAVSLRSPPGRRRGTSSVPCPPL